VSDDGHLAENDRVHHLTITAVISEGPGIEIVAAELLLDLVQRFGYQGVVAGHIGLDITTQLLPPTTS
jgi:hypothetical protein